MNKKIIRAMFKNIAEPGDPIRPSLIGVHFEAERCYATETHKLVVYNKGSEQLAGQTIAFNGDIVKGKYPDIDRVIPSNMPFDAIPIDIPQLNRAIKWYLSCPDTMKDDVLAFDNHGFNIGCLRDILTVFEAADEVGQIKMFLNENGRPAKFVSESLTAILMPVNMYDKDIDAPRYQGDIAVVSYESLINQYAQKSWRKKEPVTEMDWLR